MTPEERARKIIDEWPNIGMECDEEMVAADIVKAINEALLAEREANASIADRAQVMLYPSEGAHIASNIAQAIRARGEEEGK